MKKIVLLAFALVLLSIVLSLCVVDLLELQIVHASPYTDIEVETAHSMITNGSYPNLVVLDVRTKSEYDDGHIYGAVWIPHTELEARIDELAGHENHEIIVYCRTGVRSVNASETLESYNFTKVYNMLGGIETWQSADYPVWTATVHNVDTSFDYDMIQAAIDSPQTLDGHTISVDAGTYPEHVTMDKSISLIGEAKQNTIIDGNGTGTVVRVVASNVTISGFTIQNSGLADSIYPDCGIYIQGYSSSNNNISHNIVRNNMAGIWLQQSMNNTLIDNNMSNNQYNFLVLGWSGHYDNYIDTSNTVDGKPIYYLVGTTNAVFGAQTNAGTIYLVNCNNITVEDLTPTKNGAGVFFWNTTNSKIENITASNNLVGIWLGFSHMNVLASNNATNSYIGISLDFGSSNNTVIDSNISSNDYAGISCYYGNNNTIRRNRISNNVERGISLTSSNNTIYHNNFVSNTVQVYTEDSVNVWDNGIQGNYWSNYTGVDSNNDGIGDSPHLIDTNNQDSYPLMGMFSSFNTSIGYHVNAVTNSTIENFQYFESNSTIRITVSNMTANQTRGFCRLTIHHELLSPPYNVIINDDLTPHTTIFENETVSIIYFSYEHSTLEITIIPELPTLTSMLLILSILTVVITIYKRRLPKTPIH